MFRAVLSVVAILVGMLVTGPVFADDPAVGPNVANPERPATSTDDGSPEILLTFDDGPALDKTPRVLDELDKRHLKAVFFVTGWRFQGDSPRAEEARKLLRDIIARGHAVGNHTIHHYFLCGKVYSKRAGQEIEGNAQLIEQAIGFRPDFYRTPYGAHCRSLSATHKSLGVRSIGWDIDPEDWKVRNAVKIEAYMTRVLRRLKGRKIVLFHDVQSATVTALPRILDWIDRENAARTERGENPIKIIDYTYLLPEKKLVPPLLDALGRILFAGVRDLSTGPLGPSLAWLASRV